MNQKGAQKRPQKHHLSGQYTAYADLGIRFALNIIIFLFIGKWVDSKLGTFPVFLAIGVLFGATVGLISIYRVVFPADRRSSQKNDK